MVWEVHYKIFMTFGASQKEISISPFSSWIKDIINNYLIHHKTWHILYFYNKLDISQSTTQVESSHLDISSFSYDFTKFSTIFHFWKKKTIQDRDGLKLNRPNHASSVQQAAWPNARLGPARWLNRAETRKGGGADRRGPPVIHTGSRGWWLPAVTRRRRVLGRRWRHQRALLTQASSGVSWSGARDHRGGLPACAAGGGDPAAAYRR
jgi:hypothetical protein